jgi:hypothetical protein
VGSAKLDEALAIAFAQRFQHGAVLALRIAEVFGLHDGVGPNHVRLAAEIVDCRREIRIAAGSEQRVVEFEVGAEHRLGVPRLHRGIMAFLSFFDRLAPFPGQRQRDLRSGGPLQHLPNRINLIDVLRGEATHRSAAVAATLDEAEALELDEGLAQHVALGAEALGELFLDEPSPRREPPEDDVFLQRGDQIVRAYAAIAFARPGPMVASKAVRLLNLVR